MTKEELLKPRYKVIADYPQPAPDDCHKLLIGDILYLQKVNNGKQDIMTYMRHGRCGHMSVGVPCVGKPEKYPAVFRKLEWWEERKPDDMPHFLQTDNKWNGFAVEEVEAYFGLDKEYVKFKVSKNIPDQCDATQYCTEWFLPATEAEYLAQQQLNEPA